MPTEREHLYTDGSWTVPDRVWDSIGIGAAEFPDRELFTVEDRRITHGQFHAWVNRVGKDLGL